MECAGDPKFPTQNLKTFVWIILFPTNFYACLFLLLFHDYNDYLCLQEHVVFFIIKLLSPPVPSKYSGTESHLISYAPFLNVLLVGITPVDSVQIFSLHGAVCSDLIICILGKCFKEPPPQHIHKESLHFNSSLFPDSVGLFYHLLSGSITCCCTNANMRGFWIMHSQCVMDCCNG